VGIQDVETIPALLIQLMVKVTHWSWYSLIDPPKPGYHHVESYYSQHVSLDIKQA
jgi:hypothetical protein